MVAHVLAERTQAEVCSQHGPVPQTARPRAMPVQVGCTTMLVATPANTGKRPVICRLLKRRSGINTTYPVPGLTSRSARLTASVSPLSGSSAEQTFRSAAEGASPGDGGPALARERQLHPTKPTIHRVK